MGINGVPLHPLVVHAAVVFTPLAALAVIAFFVRTSWRVTLRLPTVVLAVVSGLSIVAAYLSGRNFLSHNPGLRQNSIVLQHQHRALPLLVVGVVFAVVAVGAVLLATVPAGTSGTARTERTATRPALATVTAILAVLLAVAVLVLVVWVGDAGARATWSGYKV